MTSYSRQDVLRILQISSRQLQGWERAGLIPQQPAYTFQDLGQLRTLRALREEDVSAASIRHSIVAMKAVAGMSNPLLEACLVRTGTRLAFRHQGAMVDPIRRQLLFDFERYGAGGTPVGRRWPAPLRRPGTVSLRGVQERFLAAVQAEEAGEKQRAIALYEEILARSELRRGLHQSGHHLFSPAPVWRAEELYRRATEVDPATCWPSSIWATCSMSWSGWTSRSRPTARPSRSRPLRRRPLQPGPGLRAQGRTAPGAAPLAGLHPAGPYGPWADHARGQIRKLLSREKLSIAWRAQCFVPRPVAKAALELVRPL